MFHILQISIWGRNNNICLRLRCCCILCITFIVISIVVIIITKVSDMFGIQGGDFCGIGGFMLLCLFCIICSKIIRIFGMFWDNISLFNSSCMSFSTFVAIKWLINDFCYTCKGFLIVKSGCVTLGVGCNIINKGQNYTQGRHKLRGLWLTYSPRTCHKCNQPDSIADNSAYVPKDNLFLNIMVVDRIHNKVNCIFYKFIDKVLFIYSWYKLIHTFLNMFLKRITIHVIGSICIIASICDHGAVFMKCIGIQWNGFQIQLCFLRLQGSKRDCRGTWMLQGGFK